MKPVIVLLFLLAPAWADAGERKYLDIIPQFWRTLYPDGGEGLYCGTRFRARDRDYNIEHIYPMSWVAKALRCGDRQACRRRNARFNEIESDMHNMYPARKDLNRERGSYPFRDIRGEKRVERGCDLEIDHRARVVEPRPASRGNIARAMLYVAERYDLKIYERQRQQLLDWHRADPVDQDERRRNRLITRVQGNANPWIEAAGKNAGGGGLGYSSPFNGKDKDELRFSPPFTDKGDDELRFSPPFEDDKGDGELRFSPPFKD